MRLSPFTLAGFGLALAASLGLAACGGGTSNGGGSYSSISGYMAGSWDFTVTNAKGRVPFVIEANLTQDHHGNISGTGSVAASGLAGNVFDFFILGSPLSSTYAVSLDYLGFTCNGSDSGDRSISGTINSTSQVTLNQNIGGSQLITMTGTMNNSATPPFTGTLTSSGPCGGGSATVVGTIARPFTGTYTGTSSVDNTETITANLNDATGSLSGNGTDSKLGNFTLNGTAVGNSLSATITYPSSPGSSGPVFGYFDPQLGMNGSLFLVSFVGTTSTSCPNAEPYYSGTCEIGILALQ